MDHQSPVAQRLHITFGKFGVLKYTGNLDIAKVWERVLRRADLPLLYTQGFNTRPRMQLAVALPLGITSECEIIDIALRELLPTVDDIPARLESVAPEGLRVYKVDDVPVNGPPLQTLVQSAEYRLTFVDPVPPETLQAAIDTVLAQERIVKIVEGKRRKSAIDLRPLILDLQVGDAGELLAHLSAGERGNLRPDDVIAQMGLTAHHYHVHKTAMHLEDYAYHPHLRDREK
jgi:radical SAM-linked protein